MTTKQILVAGTAVRMVETGDVGVVKCVHPDGSLSVSVGGWPMRILASEADRVLARLAAER